MEDLLGDLTTAQCGHVFHGRCIEHSVQIKPNCPVCRTKLQAKKLLRLTYVISLRVSGPPFVTEREDAVSKVLELTEALKNQHNEFMSLKIRSAEAVQQAENLNNSNIKLLKDKDKFQVERDYHMAMNDSLTEQLDSLQQISAQQTAELQSAKDRLEKLETLGAIMEKMKRSSSARDCNQYIDRLPLQDRVEQYKSTLLLADQKQQRLQSEIENKNYRISDLKKQASEIKYMYSKVRDQNSVLLQKLSQIDKQPSLNEPEIIDNTKQDIEDTENRLVQQKPAKTAHSLLNRSLGKKSLGPVQMSRAKQSMPSKITRYFP